MSSFSFKKGDVDRISRNLSKVATMYHDDLENKMNAVVNLVWVTARARRPKVAATKANKGQYRPSDPNATLGVPVKSGDLQKSIKKNVFWKGKKVVGEISTNLPYAKYIEYGTSRIRARPFMRPALNENAEKIKSTFRKKINPF